ncbi:MAG: Dabb family protein [Clostridia bacterium]|nr:Dabb family protein [Clostridia bacterium]
MVKHIILWKLKDEFNTPEIKADMKKSLEGLAGKVPGLLSVKVVYDKLDSSNVDVMLDTSFESEEALKGYAIHPEHVKAADEKVRPFTMTRSCIDFEE